MLLVNILLFACAFAVLIKSSSYCIRYSSRLAKHFHLSEFVVSFFIVSIISVFPEATISIMSAFQNVPSFGLGTLLGSNVTDLTLVFGVVALFSVHGVPVRSQIMKKDFLYLLLLLFPVILGLDARYSRLDGVLLIAAGLLFFITLSIESKLFRKEYINFADRSLAKNLALLILSLAVLIASANYTVKFGVAGAHDFGVPAVIVSLTFVSLGTCLPELLFSIRAIQANHCQLALGDILGTVLTDATIILGIVALIRPYSFDPILIYVTGIGMFFAGVLAIVFITTGRELSKMEGLCLIFFYLVFITVQVVAFKVF
jgi:cation:H+ antiporter